MAPGSVICARATLASGVKMGRGSLVGTSSLVPRNTDIPDWGYYSFDQLLMDYHNTRKE